MISSNFSGLGKWFLLFKKIRWVISVWFILLYLTLLAWSTTKIFMDKSSLWCFKMFQGENIVLKTLWASQKYNFLTLCWHNFYVLEQTLLPFASIIIQSPSARVKILTYFQCWTKGRRSTAVAEELRPTATATVAKVWGIPTAVGLICSFPSFFSKMEAEMQAILWLD